MHNTVLWCWDLTGYLFIYAVANVCFVWVAGHQDPITYSSSSKIWLLKRSCVSFWQPKDKSISVVHFTADGCCVLCCFQYPNEQALLCDFELMFNNARHYNEEGSVVYQDADTLDRILRAKWRSMSQSRATSSKRYVVVLVFQQAVGCVCDFQQAVFRPVYQYDLGIFCMPKI